MPRPLRGLAMTVERICNLIIGDCFEFATQILAMTNQTNLQKIAMTMDMNLFNLSLRDGVAVVAIARVKITKM